jgi:hypothetical protein
MTTLATPAIHAGFYFPGGKVPGKTKTSHLPLETNFPLADTAQQNILIPKKGDQPSINNAACSNVPGMKYLEVLMHFGLNSHQSSVQIGSELRFYYLFFFFFFFVRVRLECKLKVPERGTGQLTLCRSVLCRDK